MPIFIKNKLLFIHIPKVGGTSIEKFIVNSGDVMCLYTYGPDTLINNHSFQHCTYRELNDFGFINDKLKIFTVIRDPVERTISEYFYIKQYRLDLSEFFTNFDHFLDYFLDYENIKLFDNHNLSNFDYLKNHNDEIDSNINVFKFFEFDKIENYLSMTGLSNYSEYKTDKSYFNISQHQIDRIKNFYKNDYQYFTF